MSLKMTNHEAYNAVQRLGGDISDEEIVVEYEKTSGGTKVVGGEVVNAYENYDNRNGVRKVVIDFRSYGGDWRLVAENGTVTEVTLYSRNGTTDGDINTRRISTHDGVTDVMNAEDW